MAASAVTRELPNPAASHEFQEFALAAPTRVHPRIGTFPLENASEARASRNSGRAQFHVVLTYELFFFPG